MTNGWTGNACLLELRAPESKNIMSNNKVSGSSMMEDMKLQF